MEVPALVGRCVDDVRRTTGRTMQRTSEETRPAQAAADCRAEEQCSHGYEAATCWAFAKRRRAAGAVTVALTSARFVPAARLCGRLCAAESGLHSAPGSPAPVRTPQASVPRGHVARAAPYLVSPLVARDAAAARRRAAGAGPVLRPIIAGAVVEGDFVAGRHVARRCHQVAPLKPARGVARVVHVPATQRNPTARRSAACRFSCSGAWRVVRVCAWDTHRRVRRRDALELLWRQRVELRQALILVLARFVPASSTVRRRVSGQRPSALCPLRPPAAASTAVRLSRRRRT